MDDRIAEVNRRIPWTAGETPVPYRDGFMWTWGDHVARVGKDGRVFDSWMGLNADATSHEFVTVEVFADGSTQRVG